MITGKLLITREATTLPNGLLFCEEFDDGYSIMSPGTGISLGPGKLGNCAQGDGVMPILQTYIFGGEMTQPASTISFWAKGYVSFTGRNLYDSGRFTIIVNPDSGITVIFEDAYGYFVRRVCNNFGMYSGTWTHYVFNFLPDHPYPHIVDVYVNASKRSMDNEDFGEEISPYYDTGQDGMVTLNGGLDQYAVWQAYRYMGQDEVDLLYNNGNGLPYAQW